MKKKSGMSIKLSYLLVGFIPLLIASVSIGALGAVELSKNIKEGVQNELRVAATQLAEYFAYDIVNNGFVDYEEYADHEYMQSLKKNEVELTLFQGDTRFLTSLKNADGSYNEGTQASAEVFAAVSKGENYYSEDVVINGTEFVVYYEPIYDGTGAFWGMAFAGEPLTYVKATVNRVVTTIIAVAVGLAVVLSGLVFFIATLLSKTLVATKNGIDELSKGNLSAELPKKSIINEFNEIIDAGLNLESSLQGIIGKTKVIGSDLQSGAEQVSDLSERSKDGADQISSAIDDLAQGATSMAQNVQNINEQVIEMGMSIDNIADSTSKLVSLSESIKAANSDATAYINKVSASSEQSVTAVQDISQQIEETNSAVNNIKEAVEMISSIASQTNLLALNASIEAARAGEAGKGFAVVATEIKSLSEQSNASAEQIKTIVNEIVEKSEKSVNLSSEVATIITNEQGFIKDTQDKFEVLNREIGESLSEINEISDKVKNLNVAKVSITDSVGDLSAISEENAASNQQVAASVTGIVDAINEIASNSRTTNASAGDLATTMEYFK